MFPQQKQKSSFCCSLNCHRKLANEFYFVIKQNKMLWNSYRKKCNLPINKITVDGKLSGQTHF